MIACTSPALTVRLIPFNISFSSTSACKFLMISIYIGLVFVSNFLRHSARLSHTSFQSDGQQLLGFDGKFHRQLVQHFAGIAVDDQRHSLFRIDAALVEIKYLVFADL